MIARLNTAKRVARPGHLQDIPEWDTVPTETHAHEVAILMRGKRHRLVMCIRHRVFGWLGVCLCVVSGYACTQVNTPTAGRPGDPLPDLTPEQHERFAAGKALFDREYTPQDGLGPLFNQARCSSCHDLPALGGTGTETVVKATRFEDGSCDLLESEGGDNIQQRATQELAALGISYETPPTSANRITDVTSPSLFGLGLIEAIPFDVIETRADPNDRDNDGISGRTGATLNGARGRFGRKADFSTIHDFVAAAFGAEMGLTTPQRLAEETPNGIALPDSVDLAADPEVSAGKLALVVDFIRFLVPGAPESPSDPATRDTLRRGEQLFLQTGCAGCHVPGMQTGRSGDPAFDQKTVALYSDLLLHDLGPESRGICGVGASDTEHRTARLMGVRHRVGWMHNGAGATLQAAIAMHGGEATGVRGRFQRLSFGDQQRLLRFVASR